MATILQFGEVVEELNALEIEEAIQLRENKIRSNQELIPQMVGNLYPGILCDQIDKLNKEIKILKENNFDPNLVVSPIDTADATC